MLNIQAAAFLPSLTFFQLDSSAGAAHTLPRQTRTIERQEKTIGENEKRKDLYFTH